MRYKLVCYWLFRPHDLYSIFCHSDWSVLVFLSKLLILVHNYMKTAQYLSDQSGHLILKLFYTTLL